MTGPTLGTLRKCIDTLTAIHGKWIDANLRKMEIETEAWLDEETVRLSNRETRKAMVDRTLIDSGVMDEVAAAEKSYFSAQKEYEMSKLILSLGKNQE